MNAEKEQNRKSVLTIALFTLILFIICIISIKSYATQNSIIDQSASLQDKADYKVTFIELGSVRCIPCQKMQIVMKSIEKKYGKQVKIIFYDVWTPLGKPFSQQYGINAIPTQVFLDEKGKEFFRHEGYFPQEELVKVLKTKGVN